MTGFIISLMHQFLNIGMGRCAEHPLVLKAEL